MNIATSFSFWAGVNTAMICWRRSLPGDVVVRICLICAFCASVRSSFSNASLHFPAPGAVPSVVLAPSDVSAEALSEVAFWANKAGE